MSGIEFTIFVFAACLASIIGLGILFELVKLFGPFIPSNIQTIINVFPLVLCLAVLLSRLFLQSEKTLKRILNSHDYYTTLPIKINSLLHWSLLANFIRDSVWCVLGIILTMIIARLHHFSWIPSFGQTTLLMVLWTITGGFISFTSLITRMVLTNHIPFENKFTLKLLTYVEVLFSIIVFLIILVFRYILVNFCKLFLIENYGLNQIFFSLTIILVLYLVVTNLFSKYERQIKIYFEMENDYYSVKELPAVIDTLIKKCGSPLTQNILRLTLATRSYGFTKYYSLVVISIQAIILLLFGLNISEAPTSVIVFIIAAILSITMSFSTILTQLSFLFTITRSLPVSFREVTRSFFKGGVLLSIPACMIVMVPECISWFQQQLAGNEYFIVILYRCRPLAHVHYFSIPLFKAVV